MWLIFVIHCGLGGLVTYLLVKYPAYRQSKWVATAMLICFTSLSGAWIYMFQRWQTLGVANRYGFAFGFAVGSLILGTVWGIAWGIMFSESLSLFFYRLVMGSGGVVIKEYDKAVAAEVQGKYSEAIRWYREYIQEDRHDYVPWERIARCYLHLDMPKEAVEFLQKTSVLVNATVVRLPKDKREEELARLLFLQKLVCEKFHAPTAQITEILLTRFPHTRFGKAVATPDCFSQNYLEVWSSKIV